MDQLVNFIIRPPRADYSPNDDLLDQEFMLKGRWYQRKDLEVLNSRGNKLKCSHYVPLANPEGKELPCVIYCHGNRADASEAAIILLPSNITVFTLDLSGSGLSEGEYVTLGWNEKDDLKAVVNYLRADGNVSLIGLWGRSMGAVTSLLYGAEDPSIAGMVLDSAFSNLVDLMLELVDTYKYPLPKFTVKLAIQHMRRVIKKKAGFDITELDTIQVAKCCFVPALFGHAIDDDFIQPHHSDHIYNSYAGDKNIIKFDGDHNSPRPQFYFDSITIFFHNVLNPPTNVHDEHYPHTMHDIFDKDHWGTSLRPGYAVQNSHGQSSANSTEDALTQLRSRRPMSRTEVPPDISPQGSGVAAEEDESEASQKQFSSRQSSADHLNGRMDSLLVPSRAEDDCFEYSFDSLSDLPCSLEEEERMLMEAMIESLKDIEKRQLEEVKDVQTDPDGTILDLNNSRLLATEKNGPSEVVVKSASTSSGSESNASPALDTVRSCKTGLARTNDGTTSTSASSNADASSSVADPDTVAGTSARLIVQKGPSNSVIDSLANRWRLNFFKNNR